MTTTTTTTTAHNPYHGIRYDFPIAGAALTPISPDRVTAIDSASTFFTDGGNFALVGARYVVTVDAYEGGTLPRPLYVVTLSHLPDYAHAPGDFEWGDCINMQAWETPDRGAAVDFYGRLIAHYATRHLTDAL